MRIIIVVILTSFCALQVSAQNENANWILGQNREPGPNKTFQFTFNDGKITSKLIFKNDSARTIGNSASYSDPTTGELLLFSDGFRVYDNTFSVIPNGDSLVRGGDLDKYYFSIGVGRIHPFQSVFIPVPGKNEIYLINICVVDGLGFSKLTYNRISLDSIVPYVMEKNVIISEDNISFYPLVIQHANGKDWWLIEILRDENNLDLGFNFYLIDEKGINFHGYQKSLTQNTITHPSNRIGINMVSNFSLSLNKLVLLFSDSDNEGLYSELHIIEFDRCKGTFFNFRKEVIYDTELPIQQQTNDKEAYLGSILSPDGDFIYLISAHNIVQYKININNWKTSKVNLYSSLEPINLFYATYGLNQKIYFNELGPLFYNYKVINKPHRRGIAADFSLTSELSISNQDSFGFNRTMPTYVNYNLGPIDGSSCDTLGLDNNVDALFRHDTLGRYTGKVDFMDLSKYNPQEWAWDFDDGNTSTERYPIHQYTEAGTYNVCLTASNENGSDTYCHDVVIDGVVSTVKSTLSSFRIYPNPVTSSFVTIENPEFYLGFIEVFSIDGKLLKNENLLGTSKQQLNVAELSPGIYMFSIVTESAGTQQFKITVIE